MKKAFLGALASLMLAGAISAAAGLTTTSTAADTAAIVGDGTSPMTLSAASLNDACDRSSHER